ncbi:hypothetical protein B5S33_g1303 [[Candida] boidinii]|nr:hypothetical protein B5S30_g1681 [[Candida] boidinii]OWB82675.1 hypothetical protein B5S33_g1303 [[Candida] boidinii]
MYKHLNSSTASANSINRRISTNNPFRSALLAEEEQQRRSSEDDPTYNDWVNKNALDNISDQDDDFDVVDMYDRDSHSNALSKPKLLSVNSNSSKIGGFDPERDHFDAHDLPPSYDDIVAPGSSKNYPKDVKYRPSDDSKSSAPHPPRPSARSNSQSRQNSNNNSNINSSLKPVEMAPRRPLATNNNNGSHPITPNSRRLLDLTATEVTRIDSDGRVRSRSAGEMTKPPVLRPSNRRRDSDYDERRNGNGSSKPHRHQSTTSQHRDSSERPRRHHSTSHREREGDREHSSSHHHSSSGRRHRSKKVVLDKPKNLDTIDKLDVTGFFGGGAFHHDGPFDACTPHRNKDNKAAPVMAFPVDGPNSSLKMPASINRKAETMDMVFGIRDEDPLYSTTIKKTTSGPSSSTNYQQQQQQQQKTAPILNSASSPPNKASNYSNGIVIHKAESSLTLAESVVQFDSNTKAAPVHGDTTLGLGSSTFLDGAPAYGDTTTSKKNELSRKKSLSDRLRITSDDASNGLIRRVKSLRVSRK